MSEIESIELGGVNLPLVDVTARKMIGDIVVPTKTSELVNDSGFITSNAIPTKTSELVNDSGFITNNAIPTKTSELVNDSGFITSNAIPTKTSELVNDSGFITDVTWDGVIDKPNFSRVATSGSYNDLTNKPNIPFISASYTSPFNKLVIGDKAIVYGLTGVVNIATTNTYGAQYYADYTISIPSGVRLSAISCVNVEALSGLGLINVNILEQATNYIKIRISNAISGTFGMQFNVQMFGNK